MKKYRKTLIFTSIITLMPIIVGLLLWDQLPERMATHFASDGTANGWSHRGFAVFGLPIMLVLLQVLCMGVTLADPKKQNINDRLFGLILWLIPVISVAGNFHIYAFSLGHQTNVSTYVMILLGSIFIIIGNYLPKCRQNYTMGIKIPWTLDDEDNWNHTHRMAGYLWILGGFAMIVNAFTNYEWLLFVIIVVMGIVPMVYSYLYYRKHGKKED